MASFGSGARGDMGEGLITGDGVTVDGMLKEFSDITKGGGGGAGPQTFLLGLGGSFGCDCSCG